MSKEVHISPSHPDYKAIDFLQKLIYIATNPFLHFLAYGLGSTPIEQAKSKFEAEADAADLVKKLKDKQQELLDKI